MYLTLGLEGCNNIKLNKNPDRYSIFSNSTTDAPDQGCLSWDNYYYVGVINTDKVNSTYKFVRTIPYVSCELTHSISFLDAAGKWQPFNLSGNVLEVINDDLRTSTIKV